MESNIQGKSVKILEDFFLRETDEDLYGLLREILERPLAEKCDLNAKDNESLIEYFETFHTEA